MRENLPDKTLPPPHGNMSLAPERKFVKRNPIRWYYMIAGYGNNVCYRDNPQRRFLLKIISNNIIMKGIIYIITNSVNNKPYIGQTSTPLSDRWKSHKCVGRKYEKAKDDPRLKDKLNGAHSKLYSAMAKYGVDKFSITQLIEKECTQDELNDIEDEYILKHDAIVNGYNIKRGGANQVYTEETKKFISQRTREAHAKSEYYKKKRTTKLKDLPQYCGYEKRKCGNEYLRIGRHPKCANKSFAVNEYESLDAAIKAVREHLQKLEQE